MWTRVVTKSGCMQCRQFFFQEAVVQLKSAKAVKENLNVPVLTHGRLSNIDKAEGALESGCCDFTVIGRGMLADPDLANKVCSGHTEDIIPAFPVTKSRIGNVYRGTHITCVMNPFTGYEAERKIVKTESPKKVLVVGAGPGGCTAALLAKRAGHKVELWEKNGTIGGKTRAFCPFMKADMIRVAEYFSTQLNKEEIPRPFL